MSSELKLGDILEGKYLLRRQIGEGGMGVVYEGQHQDLEMQVAIKVLHPIEATDPSMASRFKTEAKSAASIKHSNVVEVYDYGLTPDGRPFFVMEYLEGESLADLLDRKKRLSQGDVVEIADQILSGLKLAHKRNIIHRDLKPENIFLARTEEGHRVVKVLDFGIAKIAGDGTKALPVEPGIKTSNLRSTRRFKTEGGVVMGTPGYMAPETLTGDRVIDTRADLFAVGVLMFEMLTGRAPFRGETVHEIMMATATKAVPQLRKLSPRVTREMEQLVLIALAKEPRKRFQDAKEFLTYLTAAAVGRIPEGGRRCVTSVGRPSQEPDVQRDVRDDDSLDIDMSILDDLRSQKGASNPFEPPSSTQTRRPGGAHQGYANVPMQGPYRGAARRKVRVFLPFSLWQFIVSATVLGGAGYLVWTSALFQTPMEQTAGYQIHTSVSEKRATELAAPETPKKVTIWVDVEPPDAAVMWNGDLKPERPLRVPHSTKPAKVEVIKQGYKRAVLVVTPDRTRTISTKLRKER